MVPELPHAQGPTVLSALTYLDRKQQAFGMLHRGGSVLQEYGGAMRPVVYTSHSGDYTESFSTPINFPLLFHQPRRLAETPTRVLAISRW